MTHLIFQPAGNQGGREHYRDTIENPVDLDRIAGHVDSDTLQQLRDIYGREAVPTWGATPGANDVNESKWNRIEPGDVTLFLKDGRAFASATVSLKTRSKALARELWDTKEDGQTWELIYFLRDVTARDIPYDQLNNAAGYDAANRFQGFSVLDEDRSRTALTALGISAQNRGAQRVWWVNQGTTNSFQRAGGYLWAPTHDRRGVEPIPYKNVMELRPGDVVLHYAQGIRYASRVLAPPVPSRRPKDFPANTWQEDGYRAELRYRDIEPPMPLDSIPISWRTEEAQKPSGSSAFNRNGGVVQGYLFSLSETFVNRMRGEFPQLFEEGPMQEAKSAQEVTKNRLSSVAPTLERDFELAGFLFRRDDLARFVAALMAKPFVILTGLSGSGKTKIAQGFAYWLGCTAANELCSVVAVGPDWTSKESALGFLNALDPSNYSKTDALELMLHARTHSHEPHFLILDEMNLSHVERYFADILSAMESGEDLHLHNGAGDLDVPRHMPLPANLFIVGTVNVDETTYMFSPKVLDRANVIEFRADAALMRKVMAKATRPDLSVLVGRGADYRAELVLRERDALPPDVRAKVEAELTLFFDVLMGLGYEFGYRTAIEVASFCSYHRLLLGNEWLFEKSFDAQVVQKILPRVHGSRRQIEGVLAALGSLCFESRSLTQLELTARALEAGNAPATSPMVRTGYLGTPPVYPLSAEKIARMLKRLGRNGFTSFAEA